MKEQSKLPPYSLVKGTNALHKELDNIRKEFQQKWYKTMNRAYASYLGRQPTSEDMEKMKRVCKTADGLNETLYYGDKKIGKLEYSAVGLKVRIKFTPA